MQKDYKIEVYLILSKTQHLLRFSIKTMINLVMLVFYL